MSFSPPRPEMPYFATPAARFCRFCRSNYAHHSRTREKALLLSHETRGAQCVAGWRRATFPRSEFCTVLVTLPTEPEPMESCTYKNKTYGRGETFFDACESACTCGQAGNVTCKPRCPPTEAKMSDRCVAVPDTADPCCTVVLCDVTLGDHDVGKPSMGESSRGCRD